MRLTPPGGRRGERWSLTPGPEHRTAPHPKKGSSRTGTPFIASREGSDDKNPGPRPASLCCFIVSCPRTHQLLYVSAHTPKRAGELGPWLLLPPVVAIDGGHRTGQDKGDGGTRDEEPVSGVGACSYLQSRPIRKTGAILSTHERGRAPLHFACMLNGAGSQGERLGKLGKVDYNWA